jgi:hypothetical protein
MLHSRSLKTIGQALESAKIVTFKIDTKSDAYRLCIGQVMFPFDAASLSSLRALIEKAKPTVFVSASRTRSGLADQLRAVGGYIDRIEVDEFRLVWTQSFAILDYEQADGDRGHRVFTAEELKELGLHRPLPRSVCYLPLRLEYWS